MYAALDSRVLERVKLLGIPVVEIGAGSGEWVSYLRDHGVSVIGVDLEPGAPHVVQGDGRDFGVDGGTLLAVWPPDGLEVQSWIACAKWAWVFLLCDKARIMLGESLQDFDLREAIPMTSLVKGDTWLYVFERKAS